MNTGLNSTTVKKGTQFCEIIKCHVLGGWEWLIKCHVLVGYEGLLSVMCWMGRKDLLSVMCWLGRKGLLSLIKSQIGYIYPYFVIIFEK